ncbi:hypothetical protein LXA43DRAFT_1047764 [Ganoderma leucocontextum]|nr:hypothetical protein LXA43DRAFT_1047764 [Ganoderma leucocontextum]
MFPLEAADKLTHLVMFANLHVSLPRTGHDDAIDMDIPWIIRLIDPMRHLRLTHLRIFLYHRVFHDLSGVTQRNPGAILDEDFVNAGIPSEMDLQPAATRFFDTMPTLQYVFLTACRCSYVREWPATIGYRRNNTWISSKAWRAVDANERPLPSDTMCGSCVELDREAAEAIMDREELHLLSEEEDMIRP